MAPELVRAAAELAAELSALPAPSARVSEALARLERCRRLVATPDLWPGELDRVRLPGGNGAALCTDACVAYREALDRYRAECGARAAAPVRDLLDRLLCTFGERYAERKRAISGVDFEDLELLTRELLRDDAELRERYAARFERIMVDEFQDTNRVQLELIESIARGNLFTVGDAQQSIYGFRHADVELFERRGERLAAVGARQTLQTNFRSRPEILEAINLTFASELGERFTALQPGVPVEVACRPGGGRPVGAAQRDGEPGVELLLVDKGADWALDEGLGSPWRLAEARALADRVAELVRGRGRPGRDRRADPGHHRHAGLRAGARAARAADLRDRRPRLLGASAGARHGRLPARAGQPARRGGAVHGAGLAAGRGLAGRGGGAGVGGARGGPRSVVDAARPRRARSRRCRSPSASGWPRSPSGSRPSGRGAARAGLEDLIDGVLRRTGYDLAMLAMPGGRRRLANVRKLMRLAREYEAEHGPDLRGFVDAGRRARGGAGRRLPGERGAGGRGRGSTPCG